MPAGICRIRGKVLFVLELLKGTNKAIGIKQTVKAAETGNARTVFIAKDADEKVVGGLRELCLERSIELEYVDSMKQLGRACGIEVGASAVCLLK